jgi:hypothetical protein
MCKILVLSAALYECETWYVIIRLRTHSDGVISSLLSKIMDLGGLKSQGVQKLHRNYKIRRRRTCTLKGLLR